MGIAEALVLLAMGLLVGIITTVVDVLAIGAASFVTHFSLWVLINALLAVHVESRVKATWWAIPLNLGYIEGYYLTTSASYEGFPKSLVVPLVGVALIAPLLSFAIWSAKNQKNFYGRLLSLLIIAGTLGASHFINGKTSAFDIGICVVLAVVLLVLPTRKLKITRVSRQEEAETVEGEQTSSPAEENAQPETTTPEPTRREREKRERTFESRSSRRKSASRRKIARADGERDVVRRQDEQTKDETSHSSAERPKRTLRPTRRTGRSSNVASQTFTRTSVRKRRAAEAQEAREREARLRAASETRSRQNGGVQRRVEPQPEPDGYVSTLGASRMARRSVRSTGSGNR